MTGRKKRRARDDYVDAIWASDLRPSQRLVLLALARFMGLDDLANAYPGPARLARETGLGQSTVKQMLVDLQNLGWITQTHNGGTSLAGRQFASIYRGTPRLADGRVPDLTQSSKQPDPV